MKIFAYAAMLFLVVVIGAFVAFAFYDVPVQQQTITKELSHG